MSGLVRFLRCLFGFHDFRVIGQVAPETGHFGCRNCRREWGVHFGHPVAMLPWAKCRGLAESFGYTPPDKPLP